MLIEVDYRQGPYAPRTPEIQRVAVARYGRVVLVIRRVDDAAEIDTRLPLSILPDADVEVGLAEAASPLRIEQQGISVGREKRARVGRPGVHVGVELDRR